MKPSIDLVCIVAIAVMAVAMPILATAGESVADGVRSVQSPALNAYHESRTGERVGTMELALKFASQPLPSGVLNR